MTKPIKPAAKSTTPIIDVARPNESAPSATSIPVIVNNRPILRDPMMAGDSDKADNVNQKLASVSTKINIQPSSSEDIEIPEPKPEPEVVEPKPEPAIDEELTTEAVDRSENSIVADNQSEHKNETDNEVIDTQEQAKHDAEIFEIVESKRYYLPINTVEKRRNKRFVAIGIFVSILLVLIWVDVALDAGLIKIGGLKALTHIFST